MYVCRWKVSPYFLGKWRDKCVYIQIMRLMCRNLSTTMEQPTNYSQKDDRCKNRMTCARMTGARMKGGRMTVWRMTIGRMTVCQYVRICEPLKSSYSYVHKEFSNTRTHFMHVAIRIYVCVHQLIPEEILMSTVNTKVALIQIILLSL